MANPNILEVTAITGKSVGISLSTTSATSILSNASNSGKCLKVNTLNVANYGATLAVVTVSFHNAASAGGTAFQIVGSVSVPANSTLCVIDKNSQYYLEENTSISVTSGTSNVIAVTCSYEEIS